MEDKEKKISLARSIVRNHDYKKQALDFLITTGTTLSIEQAVPQKNPIWMTKEYPNHGINYSVTLKNDKHSYTFDFWGSIADKEKIEHGNGRDTKPDAYSILAGMSPMYEDNLEDFCSSYGYDEDSRTAEKTYHACLEQDSNLRKLFTHDEIEKLSEIN